MRNAEQRRPENGGYKKRAIVAEWRGYPYFQAALVGQPETQFNKVNRALAVLRLIFLMDLPLRLIAARATYFLCFAKESKQRKATPTCRSASQTSLTAHPFFGACELAALCASSDKRTLFPEKRMLRSAERRGEGGSIKQL